MSMPIVEDFNDIAARLWQLEQKTTLSKPLPIEISLSIDGRKLAEACKEALNVLNCL